ncbi:MAG: class I mannose-6-phosphate isomerase, partial [Waddliaceae bacterium]|nr:class I mannose-6-phosphate isomerase [Waddliaceae bacterium]
MENISENSPDHPEFIAMVDHILAPRCDNFTPPERTPWGGTEIVESYKKHLGIKTEDIVGESWELSGHPSFPNTFLCDDLQVSLTELENLFSDKLYGEGITSMPFLVKLLNSRKNLSVQVHPKDGDFVDKPSKTEAWYILAAEEGAGIYLGLKEGVTKEEFEECMRSGEDVSVFLNFVEVHPGDVYFIPAGTLHAIGSGITLLEVQETSESTFRAYDWGRLQDDGT